MDIKIDPQALHAFQSLGIYGFIPILILIIVYHWTKIEEFSSSLSRLVVRLFNAGSSESLRLSLQSQLNTTIDSIDQEAPGLFGKSINVKWLESEDEFVNANKKGIFIRVKKSEDEDRLYLKSLDFLLNNALLVESRTSIHGYVMEGIKLVLSEKMIKRAGFQSALEKFRKEKYTPIMSKDKSISKATNQMEFLDYRGLFTRVFLRECVDLYKKTGIGNEGSKPRWDVSRYLEFTNDLFRSLDCDGVRANFEYSSSTLNIAFAILADEYTWATSGLDFYQKRTRLSIQRGANTINIIGLGSRNIKLANDLCAWLRTKGYLSQKYFSYYNLAYGPRNKISAICIRCEIQAQAKGKLIDKEVTLSPEIIVNDETLHQIVKSVITDQDVDIIKSAWLKGYQAQIVVYCKNPKKRVLQICIGKDAKTSKEISRLVGDYVRFVEWSPDIRTAIINNLDNHIQEEIHGIVLEPTSRFAYVLVQSNNTIHALVGKNGETLKLAEALTEYTIEFQVNPKSELKHKIKEIIPEIASGEIEILDIAILKSEEIRILVNSEIYDSPAQICGAYIEKTRTQLNADERIYFCNKKHDINDAIIAALYPLRIEDVVKVVQDTPTKYTIVVKDKDAMARGIGTDGAHVRTAGQLLGVWIQLATPE